MRYCNTCKYIIYIFADLTFGNSDLLGKPDVFDISYVSYIIYLSKKYKIFNILDKFDMSDILIYLI